MTSTTTRQLTHKLEYDTWHGCWSCSCGYVLGTGREALYAQCPDAYIEFDISTPTHEKKPKVAAAPKRQAGRRVARIYRKGQDLSGS